MSQFYVVLVQEKPAKAGAVVFWEAYRQRQDALAKCLSLARYQRDKLRSKEAVRLTKLTTPLVELGKDKVTSRLDGYQVATARFTGRYTVQTIRRLHD